MFGDHCSQNASPAVLRLDPHPGETTGSNVASWGGELTELIGRMERGYLSVLVADDDGTLVLVRLGRVRRSDTGWVLATTSELYVSTSARSAVVGWVKEKPVGSVIVSTQHVTACLG